MGSVIDYLDCPKCGNEAYNEFYYKSGEEYIMCNHCGYRRDFRITNLEDRDKTREGELFEWVPNYKLEEVDGHGAYRVRGKDTMGYEVGTFVDVNGPSEFIKMVETRKDEIAYASYTTFVDGVVTKYVIVDNELEAEAEKTTTTAEVEDMYFDNEIVENFPTEEDNLPGIK